MMDLIFADVIVLRSTDCFQQYNREVEVEGGGGGGRKEGEAMGGRM